MRMFAVIMALAAGLVAPGAAVAQDADAGRALYRAYCATCHGMEGRGDGPMGDILVIAPSDLTRLAANNGGTFPRMRAILTVDGRDPVLGHTGAMPIFGPMLEGEGAVLDAYDGTPILTTRRMADLVLWLERIQR